VSRGHSIENGAHKGTPMRHITHNKKIKSQGKYL